MEYLHKSEVKIKTPYSAGLTTCKGLMVLPLLLTAFGYALQAAGNSSWNMVCYMMGGISFGILFLSWLIIRIRSSLTASRMKDFLRNRVLLQWTYSPEEWKEMRESQWQEDKGDWRIQLGCLTFLFGLVGLLVGGMLGADKGFSEAVLGALAGLLAGFMPGAVIGGVVARINHSISRSSHSDPVPAHVALGVQEVLFNDEYFRGKGEIRYIQKAAFGKGEQSSELILRLWWPQIRTDPEKEWNIPVPEHKRREVESLLDRIAARK